MPRQERGEQRQAALLDAAVAVISQGGPASFSARSVATQAALPLAAVSYYFPRLDDLLGAAIARVVDGWVDHGEAVVATLAASDGTGPEPAAAAIADALLPAGGAAAIRHRYEHLLAAAAYPAAAACMTQLRPRLHLLIDRILTGTGTTSAIGTDALLALLDGAAVGAVAENDNSADGAAANRDLRWRITSLVQMALTESPSDEGQPIQSANARPEMRS